MSAWAVIERPYSCRSGRCRDNGTDGFHGATNCLDMLRRGPATTADEPHAIPYKLLRIRRHVLRRAEVDISSLDILRFSRIRLHGQLLRRDSSDSLDDIQHRLRTHTAVQANNICAPLLDPLHEGFRRGA